MAGHVVAEQRADGSLPSPCAEAILVVVDSRTSRACGWRSDIRTASRPRAQLSTRLRSSAPTSCRRSGKVCGGPASSNLTTELFAPADEPHRAPVGPRLQEQGYETQPPR